MRLGEKDRLPVARGGWGEVNRNGGFPQTHQVRQGIPSRRVNNRTVVYPPTVVYGFFRKSVFLFAIFIWLVFSGPGKVSTDHFVARRLGFEDHKAYG